ncbi:hypothetical protein YC2023_094381 [Brassica napus]
MSQRSQRLFSTYLGIWSTNNESQLNMWNHVQQHYEVEGAELLPETCYSSRSHSLLCLIKNNGSSHETLSCKIVISRYEDPNSLFLSIIDVYPEMIINET